MNKHERIYARSVSDGILELPFSGSTPIAKHCSAQGAQTAQPRAGSQALKVLCLIQAHTLLTDHELADLAGLPLATICARRNFLMQKGLIVACGSKLSKFGVRNTLWKLTER